MTAWLSVRRGTAIDRVWPAKHRLRRNALIYVGKGSNRRAIKRYIGNAKHFNAYKHRFLGLFGRPCPTLYWPPRERCSLERSILELWNEHGYSAPRVMPCPSKYECDTVLCMEYVPGPKIGDVLRGERSSDAVDRIVQTQFREMRRRHLHAFEISEPHLIHVDVSSRNILMSPRGPVHIDFEATRTDETITQLATREVLKLCLALCESLDDGRAGVATRLVECYGLNDVLDLLLERERRRGRTLGHRLKSLQRESQSSRVTVRREFMEALSAAV